MKRRIFCLLTSLCVITLSARSQAIDSLLTKTMSPNDLHKDFNYLRRILTETHPGLYRYTPKEKMQSKMDSINSLLDKPMLFYDFYSILSELVADVRCAHTYVIPVKDIEPYFLNRIKTIPLIPFAIGDKFYVTVNGTADTIVKPGFEILEINGQPMTTIRDKMYRHIWADGHNKTLKGKTMNEAFFPLFYYLMMERSETFTVKLRDLNGAEKDITLSAQRFNDIHKFFNKNKVNKEIMAIST